ncbi:MAG: hypothetical protein H7X95_02000 [Deltaproteobacteria bacterium]|nr:hypothetical protein [Deltaproteobacteria bacterium]
MARPYPAPTAALLADVLSARQRTISSMNARVRATSWLGGDRVRATVLMLVDRPGRLRFEAEVSLQGTVAMLATDGRRFAFLDMMKNEMRSGPACPANVASLIRIPLGPADVAAILLADARLPTGTNAADGVVDWDPTQAADVLAVRRNDGWLRVLFHDAGQGGVGDLAARLRIVGAIATGPDGRVRWRVAYEDFVDVSLGGETTESPASKARVSLPQTIRFAEGDASFDEGVEIKFKERTLNDPPADSAFALSPAAGTTIVEVGCPVGGVSARP